MIDAEHDLPLTRQADLLGISRSTIYYEAAGPSERDLEIMREIDRLHMDYPYMGARMLRDTLRLAGFRLGRRHVARLMRVMGIEALYRKKSTSRRNPEHTVFPYLLRDVVIEKPNHAWCADIMYIPMERGFVYLFAVMDWATRRILAWRISIERISRSILSCFFSRRKRESSMRSSLVRPSLRRPASRSTCLIQLRTGCRARPKSVASSSGCRPQRASSTTFCRNSGG
jgi:putative transposase